MSGVRRALVVGASGGIGAALFRALEASGAEMVGLSRSGDGLDVTREETVAGALAALDGTFDLLFVASGALTVGGHQPEKTIRRLEPDAMLGQFATNALGPALVLKHGFRLIPREGRAVVAVLTARVGSIGDNKLGGWYSYRAAKAAANQVVRGFSVELGRTHPEAICVALHPGTVATAFTEGYSERYPTATPDEAAANLLSVLEGLTPNETGQFFDWKGDPIPW